MDMAIERSNPGWHRPVFGETLCGTKTDRERLGLPDHYVPGQFDGDLSGAADRLRPVSRTRLAAICEDPAVPLSDRLAAGTLLGLVGDPRIDPGKPVMIAIAGGSVSIGLDPGGVDAVLERNPGLGLERKWLEKETPAHIVELGPYAIAKYPVTNKEYREFLIETRNPALPSSWAFRRYPAGFSNHPVYTVSPAAADDYAAWLSARTRRRFRLPTEAEWEYAAAGPDGLEFPWGGEFDADRANTAETGLFQTSPVGVFADGNSPFGVADMAGNVEEYVSDLYQPYPGGSFVTDHLVDIHGTYRVARGGCFARFRDLARTRRRHGHNPRSSTYAMGFRLAEDIR